MAITCPECHSENPETKQFCADCGTRIRGHVPDSPESGTCPQDSPEQSEVRLTSDEKDRFASRARLFPMIVFQRDAQNRLTGFIIDSDPVRDLVFKKK